jgi:hypothetical protein
LKKSTARFAGYLAQRIQERYPKATVAISAKTRVVFDSLMAELGATLRPIRMACELGRAA